MSQSETPQHDPWKFSSSSDKAGDFIPVFIKRVLLVCVIFSVVFFFFYSTTQSRWPRYSFSNSLVRNTVEVQHLEVTNISHILFGIGGTAKTWKNRRLYSELWWKHNITRGYVWLDENPETWPNTSPPYRVSEPTSKFKYTNSYGSRSAIRIARILVESYRLGLDSVKWFVLGDDDTVFFMENLVEVLSKYDHNQMYYIGGNSESVEQDVIHSYNMAYGGGGIAISYALMSQLVKILDQCLDRYSELYGSDERIGACVKELGVPLTRELGFHQIDIRGDPYGILAAHQVAPLVSLHHLDAVRPIFPTGNQVESLQFLMAAYKMDPSRTLQQSFCYNVEPKWSISVSWGYTVQIYPSLLTAKALGTPLRTFSTWRTWRKGPFRFNTREISSEACERPVIFYLDHVDDVSQEETLTSYKRVFDEKKEECGVATYAPILALQTVNVSSSKMHHEDWNKARRRQCCEIINHYDSALQIKIRSCGAGETVSPP